MALPLSGQISASDIRAELGVSVSNFSIYTARNGGYVTLNPYSPYLPKTTGDARYSDWYGYCQLCTPSYPYSFTVYYASPHSNYQCFATKALACAHSPSYSMTVYSTSSTITSGAVLYAFNGTSYYPMTWSTNGGGDLWLYDGTGNQPFYMTNNSGVTTSTVAGVDVCSGSAVRRFISFSNTSYGAVCTSLNRVRLYYDSSIGFGPGTSLWIDSALSIPYSNPYGYFYCALLYADGGNGHIYNFGGGNIVGSDIGIIC